MVQKQPAKKQAPAKKQPSEKLEAIKKQYPKEPSKPLHGHGTCVPQGACRCQTRK